MKPLTIGSVVLAAVSLAPAQTQAPAQAQAPKKIQALIITGQTTPGHDWYGTSQALRKQLLDTGLFDVRVTEEFRGAGPETLAPYDVAIVNYYDANRPTSRWGERTDAAFLDYVRGGKGLLIFHFTVASFIGWTEFEKICAGNWRPNQGHHSARHDFTVDIKDADHPVLRGMKASFPQVNDELYANLKWQPAESYHLLATAWDDHSKYRPNEKQPVTGPGLNQPMLWTVNYGSGRVFVTALGHDADAMKSAGFIATFVRGAEWAATGNVTIPLPDELKR